MKFNFLPGLANWVWVLWAIAVGGGPPALAQVSLTKHDLTISTVNRSNGADARATTCVFCHTPYGADTSSRPPLWNRLQAAKGGYITFNSLGTSSLDGPEAPVGSVSISCLSCHDGVQAMNVLINSPGAGLDRDPTGPGLTPGKPASTLIQGAGLNDSDSHPFGVPYGGVPADQGSAQAAGPFRKPESDFSGMQSALLNGQQVWWVDTDGGAKGAREKTDIQLYTRVVSQRVIPSGELSAQRVDEPQPFVECASCHDPHSAANGTFLRVLNTGSAVCLACHSGK